jgi:hypothetical protein
VADTGPSARNRAALAFDLARSQYVLFGGTDDQGELDDTWTYDGTAWTQVADTGPSPRAGHAMAYDPAREQVVLFGGLRGGQPDGETWTWDGTAWTQAQNAGPSARSGHVLAGDVSSVWLFGGGPGQAAGAAGLHGDSWEWDGSNWTQRQDIGPSPRIDASAALDSGRERIVLFGGAVSGAGPNATDLLGDTWEARVGDDSPSPGVPNPDFTIDASEMMVAGSPLGFVTVVLATPSSTDWPVSVTVNGVVESIGSPPIRAGQTGSWALFAMSAHASGTLNVKVTVGTKVEDATVTVVGGHRLQSVAVSPTSVVRGSLVQATVTGSWTFEPLLVGILSLNVDVPLGQVQMNVSPPGPVTVPVPIPPSVGIGTHRLIAVAKGGPGPTGVSVAGPVELTVT